MLRSVPRQKIFNDFPNLGGEIARIQKESYDADELDYFDTEADKVSYLESFDALLLPENGLDCHYKVLSFHHSHPGTFVSELTERLLELMDLAGIEPNLAIAHIRTSLTQNGRRRPVMGNALKAFARIFPEPDFQSAFLFEAGDFPVLVDLFFNLARFEPAAPEYIFFADRQDRVAFFICRYGNIHTVEFGREILAAEKIAAAQLFELKTRCYEKFR